MASTVKASIIVNNYNYGRYLKDAIDSALHQTYNPLEVIVVDDGSTDHSAEVIRGFGDRITAVMKPNGGQASAFNAGFATSRGEVVFFLDADDLLAPGAVEAVVEALQETPQAVRVQYRMEVIDADGNPTGIVKPFGHLPLRSGDLRRHVLTFPFDIPWMPTSGNAFTSQVLRQILPMPEEEFRILADYYLSNVTPLFGPVLFLDEVLASYRVHGANSYEQLQPEIDLEQIRKTITHACQTREYLEKFSGKVGADLGGINREEILSVSYVANRLVSFKLDPARHPMKDDTLRKLFSQGISASLRRFDVSWLMRLGFVLWFAAMAVAPRPVAGWLGRSFLYPQRRGGLNKLLGSLHRA
ncbi:MAG TPA: glycosyltransferase [Anaerolineales bacterium]